MNNDNQTVVSEQTLPDGLLLTVGEMADGKFGWWIDAPGSEMKLLTRGRPSAVRGRAPGALVHGIAATFDAAVEAGKKAWKENYGAKTPRKGNPQ
jgi:hypothetical protein